LGCCCAVRFVAITFGTKLKLWSINMTEEQQKKYAEMSMLLNFASEKIIEMEERIKTLEKLVRNLDRKLLTRKK